MNERVYLDWNASARLRPEAREAAIAGLDVLGNPSSVHSEGRAGHRMIEAARESVAALVGADPALVTFTSGATEANLLALTPAIETDGEKKPRDRLLVSAIEHASVLCGGRFSLEAVETITVAKNGVVDLAYLRDRLAALKASGVMRPLVSVMFANNETGVIQPVCGVANLAHEAGGLLHVDAVQGAGKIPCNINILEADILTISAHKIGGPKGAGALIRRSERVHIRDPLVKGGGQERGYRGGTENVVGIAGFGAAARAAAARYAEESSSTKILRDRLEAGIKSISPSAVIFGDEVDRLPNTTLFAVSGIKAETALIAFDLEGIAVSSGAACSSGKVQPSHVLAAMGVDPALAAGAVRVSLGWDSTGRDIEIFLDAWKKLIKSLGKIKHDIAA